MERPVKERLVGAAVLMAAAVILIPEMLSGPDLDEHAATQRAAGETPLKTYTIDLSKSPGAQLAPEGLAVGAPSREEIVALSAAVEAEPVSAIPATSAQAKPESEAASSTAAVAPTAAASSDSKPAVDPPTPAVPPARARQTRVSAPPPPPSGSWAVQLGSFLQQATAERLATELRAEGYEAFVMPTRSGTSTLYRVRVGPMKDESSARAALRVLQAKAPGAAVVAHP